MIYIQRKHPYKHPYTFFLSLERQFHVDHKLVAIQAASENRDWLEMGMLSVGIDGDTSNSDSGDGCANMRIY